MKPRHRRLHRFRSRSPLPGWVWAAALVLALGPCGARPGGAAAPPVRVVATTPDLGSLVETIGGDQVAVTVLAGGRQDAHFVEAKPSFIKELSQADLFVQVGMELELGYVPVLLQNARNGRVLPGNPGYLDASASITPLDRPAGIIDRTMGDVHPFGNPHYLADPLNGVAVAKAVSERLSDLRPERAAEFRQRYEALRQRIFAALVGATLAGKYDAEKLARLYEYGKLEDFLAAQGDAGTLGGWLGLMAPYHGTKVVDDHPLWPYFARRFGLVIDGHMEPRPGIPPSTGHLTELAEQMKVDGVKIVITAPYYDPRYARFIADATGATVVPLAHQVDSLPGTGDYFSMVDYNVRALAGAVQRNTTGG